MTLRDVADELYLSGRTATRLTPHAIHYIERSAIQKLRLSMGSTRS